MQVLFHIEGAHQGGVIPVDTNPHTAQTISATASISEIHAVIDHVAPTHYQKPTNGKQLSPDLIPIGGGGGGYDDWSNEYGWYADDSYEGYAGNADSDGSPDSTPQSETNTIGNEIFGVDTNGAVHVVNVTYNYTASDGKNGDQPITQALAAEVTAIVGATPGITSVDVSCTTNGHAVEGAPYDHQQGRAVDIDAINGIAVSKTGPGANLALALEAQALADPNIRYVEGPGGNWARSSPGASWVSTKDLPTMNNHVHFATFNN